MVTPQSVQGHTGLTHHFSIFDIRTLWRSGLSAREPECQKLKNGGLDQYGPERFGTLILLQSEQYGTERVNLHQSTFYKGHIDVSDRIRRHCVTNGDEKRSSTAHFLRDSVIPRDIVGRFACSCILSRDELNSVIQYLFFLLSFLTSYLHSLCCVLSVRFDYK